MSGYLQAFAESYSSLLVEGDKIRAEGGEWNLVKPVLHLLPDLLAKRGLRLEMRGDSGWVVKALVLGTDNVFACGDEEPTRIQCRTCRADWWQCPCRGYLPIVAFDETAVGRRGAQG